jgi:hypothetical protein
MLIKADSSNDKEDLTISLDFVAIGSSLIEAGRPDGYAEFRKWAVGRFGENAAMLDVSRLLHAVLLLPADPDSLAKLDRMKAVLEQSEFDKAKLKSNWDREAAIWRAFGLAMLEYRQGRPARARHWAEVGMGFRENRDYINAALEPVFAMACFRLGDVKSAKTTLARTRRRIDRAFSPDLPAAYEPLGQYQGYWWDWIIARILFREAEALIDGGAAAPK